MVIFSYSGTSPATVVTFIRDPDVGDYTVNRRYLNPRAQAGGGVRYEHDKGVCKEIRTLRWAWMRAVDFAALQAFLDAVDGASNSFDLTDPAGEEFTARIWNAEEIRSMTVMHETEEITIEVLVDVAA